jgi:hypothetical protein
MQSLRIVFKETGAVLDLENLVTGFNAVVQDTLTNIGTRLDTDGIDPDRGCSLEKNALQTGVVISTTAATHVSNIANAETFAYIDENEDQNEDNGLSNLELQPVEFTPGKLNINAVMTSVQGESRGLSTPLPI